MSDNDSDMNDNDLNAAEVARILWRRVSIEDATEAIVRYVLALKALGVTAGSDAVRKIREATTKKGA